MVLLELLGANWSNRERRLRKATQKPFWAMSIPIRVDELSKKKARSYCFKFRLLGVQSWPKSVLAGFDFRQFLLVENNVYNEASYRKHVKVLRFLSTSLIFTRTRWFVPEGHVIDRERYWTKLNYWFLSNNVFLSSFLIVFIFLILLSQALVLFLFRKTKRFSIKERARINVVIH